MNKAGYKAIKEKAFELLARNPELLDCYNRDLYVHDKATLFADDAPKHFYWAIGVTGTYFGRPEHIYSMITSGWQSGNIRHHFYFDGNTLHDITAYTIDEVIQNWRKADYGRPDYSQEQVLKERFRRNSLWLQEMGISRCREEAAWWVCNPYQH